MITSNFFNLTNNLGLGLHTDLMNSFFESPKLKLRLAKRYVRDYVSDLFKNALTLVSNYDEPTRAQYTANTVKEHKMWKKVAISNDLPTLIKPISWCHYL